MVATWRRRPGIRLASNITVAARLNTPQAPSTRLTAAVDWPVARRGSCWRRLQRSAPSSGSARWFARHRLCGHERASTSTRCAACESATGRPAGRPCCSLDAQGRLRELPVTASAMPAKHGRTVADRLAHSGEPTGANPLPDEGLVTMPHHPLLQANACMPRSWNFRSAVSLPPIAALHPDRPDELAAGAAALRDGRVADAIAAYDRALERLSADGQPEQRGAALLARGLAYQLLGDTSKATTDVLSALNVWALVRPDWASSAMSDLARHCRARATEQRMRTGRRRSASPSAAGMSGSRRPSPVSGGGTQPAQAMP